jgi:TolB-like protein
MKYTRLKQYLFLAVLFFVSILYCAAQTRQDRIAILSFNGGSSDERDGIAELFSFQRPIMDNFTVIPRTTITNAISREQSFQTSGMTNADTIARLGNQFGANYVMAGSITSLGNSNLLIVSIVKIDVIQMVAGDFITYNTLDDLTKNRSIILKMAENLISMIQNDTKDMHRLAVVPVQFTGDVNKEDGDALAQLLSIHLIRNGKYAVYPRTQSLEQVQQEYKTQYSGVTRDSQAVVLGRGTNPEYVLSIASRRIGSMNTFNASVIDLEGGHQIDGLSEQYANLTDGINAMDFVARQLSGVQVSDRERSRRTSGVSSALSAEEREAARAEAAVARAVAADRFLRKSAFIADGWFGFKIPSEETDAAKYSGGGLLGMRYGLFGLQTGINFMGSNILVQVNSQVNSLDENIALTVFQLPVLARLNINFMESLIYISPYAGIGINLSSYSDNKDLKVQSLSTMSFIGGADIAMNLSLMKVFIGVQYNSDIEDNVIQYNGQEYKYKNPIFNLTLGLHFDVPFRKD